MASAGTSQSHKKAKTNKMSALNYSEESFDFKKDDCSSSDASSRAKATRQKHDIAETRRWNKQGRSATNQRSKEQQPP